MTTSLVSGPWSMVLRSRLFHSVASGMLVIALLGSQVVAAEIAVRRLAENPIIRPEMLPGNDGANINGPSLIRAPAWLPDRLGNYYLYFAHHGGSYIRLAYADKIEGPWKICAPGTLHLAEARGCQGHIASPDIIVDEARHELRMYFHGPSRTGEGQKSFVALSPDGVHFTAQEDILGSFYFRVFAHEGWWYALAKGGELYRSRDGLHGFERSHFVFPGFDNRVGDFNDPGPRHVAVLPRGNTLWVYYTNIGDTPERIFRAAVALTADWHQWRTQPPEEVLRPEAEWEGARLPIRPSQAGAVKGAEHALRDPAIFTDTDGRNYLVYSVAGERGLAIAELK